MQTFLSPLWSKYHATLVEREQPAIQTARTSGLLVFMFACPGKHRHDICSAHPYLIRWAIPRTKGTKCGSTPQVGSLGRMTSVHPFPREGCSTIVGSTRLPPRLGLLERYAIDRIHSARVFANALVIYHPRLHDTHDTEGRQEAQVKISAIPVTTIPATSPRNPSPHRQFVVFCGVHCGSRGPEESARPPRLATSRLLMCCPLRCWVRVRVDAAVDRGRCCRGRRVMLRLSVALWPLLLLF